MPNKKMTFPKVPGDTPRERFMNLVRHVFSVSKSEIEQAEKRPTKSRHRPPPKNKLSSSQEALGFWFLSTTERANE